MTFSGLGAWINQKSAPLAMMGVALATVLAVGLILRCASFNSDLSAILPLPSEERAQQETLLRGFAPLTGATTLAVETSDLGQILPQFEGAILDLWLADGVASVASLLALPRAPNAGTPEEPLAGLNPDAPMVRAVMAPDRSLTLVTILWTAEATAAQRAASTAQFVATLQTTARVTDISPDALSQTMAKALQDDQMRLMAVSVALCIALALWVMGGWRAALTVTVPPILGVIWAVALISALGIALNPLLMVVPTILLVLGVADAIHFAHAMAQAHARLPAAQAAWAGFKQTWPAAVLTSLSTGLAFALMALLAPTALADLAVFGVIGLIAQTLAVALGTTALFALLAPKHRPAQSGALVRLAHRALAHRRAVTAVTFAALTATAASVPMLGATHDIASSLPRGSAMAQLLQRIDTDLAGADRLFLITPAADPTPGLQQADLTRLAALMGLDATPNADAQALAGFESSDSAMLALPVPVSLLTPSDQIVAQAQTLHRAAQDRLAPAPVDIVGPSLTAAAEMPDLLFRLSLAFYLTAGVIGLGAWVILRSGRAALAFMAPNLLTLLSVSALFVVTGQPLTMTGAIVMTVAFGIAVDDTIHLMHRLHRTNRGAITHAVMAETLTQAAPPVWRTTILISAGFATLMLSSIPAIQGAGLVLALAAALALVFDLLVLPALLVGLRLR